MLGRMENNLNFQFLKTMKILLKNELKSQLNSLVQELKTLKFDPQVDLSISNQPEIKITNLIEENLNKFELSQNSFEEIKYLQSLFNNFSQLATNLQDPLLVNKINNSINIIQQVINFFENNLEKFESNNKTTTQASNLPTSSDQNSNWSVYIAFIILFLFILVILFRRCNRKTRNKNVYYVQYKSDKSQIPDF
jgi:hypothetical protein